MSKKSSNSENITPLKEISKKRLTTVSRRMDNKDPAAAAAAAMSGNNTSGPDTDTDTSTSYTPQEGQGRSSRLSSNKLKSGARPGSGPPVQKSRPASKRNSRPSSKSKSIAGADTKTNKGKENGQLQASQEKTALRVQQNADPDHNDELIVSTSTLGLSCANNPEPLQIEIPADVDEDWFDSYLKTRRDGIKDPLTSRESRGIKSNTRRR